MYIKNLTIYLFITSLLFSSIGWAGEGLLDNMLDSNNVISSNSNYSDIHNNVMHHLVDKHHSDHDCHMASHLIGLNSHIVVIAHFNVSEFYTSLNTPFSTLKTAPPSKPPRV